MRLARTFVLILSTGLTTNCREVSRPATTLPRIEEGAGLLFTFFDNTAQMRTVDRLAEVPKEARPAVMVTTMSGRGPAGNLVYVTDLTKMSKETGYRVWTEERGHWLDRVMPRASVAKLAPPAKTRRRRRPGHHRPPAAGKSVNATSAEPTPAAKSEAQQPKVVMFSTSWCPSCRNARQFLSQNQVPFIELDVERNQKAAEQMVAIQRARGMREGAVPLIVVGNQVFQGFSRMQLAGAIAKL